MYMVSEDRGTNWLTSAGDAIAGPARVDTPGITVSPISRGYGLMNTHGQAVDAGHGGEAFQDAQKEACEHSAWQGAHAADDDDVPRGCRHFADRHGEADDAQTLPGLWLC